MSLINVNNIIKNINLKSYSKNYVFFLMLIITPKIILTNLIIVNVNIYNYKKLISKILKFYVQNSVLINIKN